MAEAEAAAFPLCTVGGINKDYIKSPCGIVKLVQIIASFVAFLLMMLTKDRKLLRGIPFTIVTVVAIIFTGTMLIFYLTFFVDDPDETGFSWLRLQLYFCFGLFVAYLVTVSIVMGQTVMVSFAAVFGLVAMCAYAFDVFIKMKAIQGICLLGLLCVLASKKRSVFGPVLFTMTAMVAIVFTFVMLILYLLYVVEETDEFEFSYLRLQFAVCVALAVVFLITSTIIITAGGTLTVAAVSALLALLSAVISDSRDNFIGYYFMILCLICILYSSIMMGLYILNVVSPIEQMDCRFSWLKFQLIFCCVLFVVMLQTVVSVFILIDMNILKSTALIFMGIFLLVAVIAYGFDALIKIIAIQRNDEERYDCD